MNTFKKTGGFTLVELIIVIAILAILSSVAVAGYSSYIKKANNSAVNSFLTEVKTHVVLANAEAGDVGAIRVVPTKDAKGKTTALTVYVQQSAPGFSSKFDSNINGVYTGCADYTVTGWKSFTVSVPSAWDNSDYANGTEFGTSWSEKATVTAPAAPTPDPEGE